MPLGFSNATRRAAANTAVSGGSGIGLLGGGFGGDPLSTGNPVGTLEYTLEAPQGAGDTDYFDYFGWDMKFTPDGTKLVISQRYGDEGSSQTKGSVHCYDATDGTLEWSFYGDNIGDRLGTDVEVTNNMVFVNSPEWDYSSFTRLGKYTAINISNGTEAFSIEGNNSNTGSAFKNKRFAWGIAANPNDDGSVAYVPAFDTMYYFNSSGSYEGNRTGVIGTGNLNMELSGNGDAIIATYDAYDRARVYTWSRGYLGELSKPSGYSTFGDLSAISSSFIAISDQGWSSSRGRITLYDTATRNFVRNINNPETVNTNFTGSLTNSMDIYEDLFLLAGANQSDPSSISNAGKAFLFDPTDGSTITTVTSPNAASNGYFGMGTAVARHRFAVGAPGEVTSGSGGTTNAGRVYVYSTGA